MASVEDVARSALSAIDTDADVELAGTWVRDRLTEACAYGRFRFLRRTITLLWPAPVTAGTVAVTEGSDTVTGTSTAWTDVLIGRYFRAATAWYKIVSVPSPTSLQLESVYTEKSATATSYSIVQQVLPMVGFRRIDQVICPRLRRSPLDIVSQERLNELAPSRIFLSSGPRYVTAAGEIDGELQIELYPYSSRDETIRVTGYLRPPHLQLADRLPGAIDLSILKDGVLVDCYRYEQARALRKDQKEAAMLWQQQMVAQEARWRNSRALLAMQDREVDDAMISVSSSTPERYNTDIVTAYDEVYARGRPV